MLEEAWSEICSRHRQDILLYLIIKTAAVRCGEKPGELLRVPCWLSGSSGETIYSPLKPVLSRLGLPYRVLRRETTGALVLFYHPACLEAQLAGRGVRRILKRAGYPSGCSVIRALDELQMRWQRDMAHEVGVFIGYPPADVEGFLLSAKAHPAAPGDRWRIFGNARRSRQRMAHYRALELQAVDICQRYHPVSERFLHIAALSRGAGWKEYRVCAGKRPGTCIGEERFRHDAVCLQHRPASGETPGRIRSDFRARNVLGEVQRVSGVCEVKEEKP